MCVNMCFFKVYRVVVYNNIGKGIKVLIYEF